MKLKCPHCKYEWECKSKMMFITCSNCRKKIDNPEYEIQTKK